MGLVRRFLADERGDGAIEYGLLAGMLACFVLSALQKIGVNVNNKVRVLSNALS